MSAVPLDEQTGMDSQGCVRMDDARQRAEEKETCPRCRLSRHQGVDALRTNSDVIEEIKSRIDIVDVVSRVVDLKKAGRNYKGLCPFHNEKTPSFVVSEEKQIFTCFGCGKTGDVIEFEKEYHGIDFMTAVEKLADECGVKIIRRGGSEKERAALLEINRQAARFFYINMRSRPNPGMEYMRRRGLNQETMHAFGIGYADGSWDSLLKYLKQRGFEEEQMLQLGLISKSRGSYYDKFRDRVIFPIRSTQNKVIGFGGRAIGDAMPKYLNSSESSIFKKKSNLYDLSLAKNAIGSQDCAILVEGYMDVIALHQSGIENAAASLGTALTEQQAALLKRYTKNVVLCYDADAAGQAAALRGMDILHRAGIKVRVMHVTDGKDPDEFIKKRGRAAFDALVDAALPFAEYKLKVLQTRFDLGETEGRIGFLEEAARVLNQLSPVEADIYIKKLSADYGISEQALHAQQEIRKSTPRTGRVRRGRTQQQSGLNPPEKSVLKVLMTDAAYLEQEPGIEKVFTSPAGVRIYQAIAAMHREGVPVTAVTCAERLSEEDAQMLRDALDGVLLGSVDQVLSDCLAAAEESRLREEEEKIIARLSLADEDDNDEEINRLTRRLMEVQKELTTLKAR